MGASKPSFAASNFRQQEIIMNSDTISGNWKQMKGKMKEQWGKLTDDDFKVIEGKDRQTAKIHRIE